MKYTFRVKFYYYDGINNSIGNAIISDESLDSAIERLKERIISFDLIEVEQYLDSDIIIINQ